MAWELTRTCSKRKCARFVECSHLDSKRWIILFLFQWCYEYELLSIEIYWQLAVLEYSQHRALVSSRGVTKLCCNNIKLSAVWSFFLSIIPSWSRASLHQLKKMGLLKSRLINVFFFIAFITCSKGTGGMIAKNSWMNGGWWWQLQLNHFIPQLIFTM